MNKINESILISDDLELFANSDWGNGKSLLHLAVQQDDIKLVKQCIQLNAEVNMVDRQGCTALFYCKSLEIAKFLVDNGVDVNILDRCYDTAVVSLYKRVNIDIIKYLAEITNLDIEDNKSNYSLLLYQMIRNQELDLSLFEIVIPRIKNINRITRNSESYLMMAAQNRKYLNVIMMLVESGIDQYMRNRDGKNFYDLSFQYVQEEIKKKYPEFIKYKDMTDDQRKRKIKLEQLGRISE
jgi:ankyrin repeat protein